MIILLGPDGSGKTTIAKELSSRYNKPYYHFVKDSGYRDYIPPLSHLDMTDGVLDRFAICELPYSICMNREFKFVSKQWHNILLLTLIQKPLIILCTHKPHEYQYPKDQYLPYSKWDQCLRLYEDFLNTNYITHTTLDYVQGVDYDSIIKTEKDLNSSNAWWRSHWQAGYGCVGSSHPKFLIVAERIGPNNMNNIPFETGPTGYMLSRVLANTKTPLGAIAITNMVKSHRGDARKVNDRDLELLREEIDHLRPKKIVFMGATSKLGIPVAKEFGCEYDTIVHLGALNHRGVKDLTGYCNEFKKILGIVPTISFS